MYQTQGERSPRPHDVPVKTMPRPVHKIALCVFVCACVPVCVAGQRKYTVMWSPITCCTSFHINWFLSACGRRGASWFTLSSHFSRFSTVTPKKLQTNRCVRILKFDNTRTKTDNRMRKCRLFFTDNFTWDCCQVFDKETNMKTSHDITMTWTVWKTLELRGFNVCSHFLFGWVCCKCTRWQQQSFCAYSGTGKEKDILILIFTAATIWGRTATLEKWTFKWSDWFQGTRDQLKLLLHPPPTTITTATP